MFAIARQEQPYPAYILSDPTAQSSLEVVPDRGGIVTQWRWQDHDILYLDRDRFAQPDLSVRGGIPILFPICGNLPNDTYSWEGLSYKLPQHGFARNLPWEVVAQSTEGRASLTLALRSQAQTRAVYPFDFELEFTYRLYGNHLEIQQRYTNHSKQPMPFSTGLHPYFAVTDKTQLQLSLPASHYQSKDATTLTPFTGSFDFDQEEIDVALPNLSRQTATVRDLQRRLQLTLDYDPNYSTLVFWTVKGKDYYCLEPWSAPRNALNTGTHLTTLAPGTHLETCVGMTVLPL